MKNKNFMDANGLLFLSFVAISSNAIITFVPGWPLRLVLFVAAFLLANYVYKGICKITRSFSPKILNHGAIKIIIILATFGALYGIFSF